MTLDRVASSASAVDVLDHVLDKGVVIDTWVRVSVAGIDLITVEARIVVASIATYLGRSHSVKEQLHRILEQIKHRHFESRERRRAEDYVRDAWHDAHAHTIRA